MEVSIILIFSQLITGNIQDNISLNVGASRKFESCKKKKDSINILCQFLENVHRCVGDITGRFHNLVIYSSISSRKENIIQREHPYPASPHCLLNRLCTI